MAENRRGKGNRLYFTRGQLVLLGGGFTLASVVIFVLGMLVGKSIEERKMIKPPEPAVKIPVKPGAGERDAAATAPKEELTFYETLTKSPPGDARADAKAKEVKASAAKSEPGEQGKAQGSKPDEKRPGRAPEAGVKTASAGTEKAEKKETGAVWTVQVNAFPDDRSAKLLVDRLKNKGYNAYMTEAHTKGKTWYRVRVGRYASREEAEKVEEILRSKESLPKAFATSRKLGG
ncbi:MAG TPA: SPOR domain-containing protein [candidate division Zixibacteria bacterium]|nr:SPOR domain-containing protein [candidate division Zixibacteria bacterium]